MKKYFKYCNGGPKLMSFWKILCDGSQKAFCYDHNIELILKCDS